MMPSRHDELGSVALETALVAPVVALLVAGVVGAVSVVTDQLAAERAARATARAIAVTGQPGAAAAALPPGATVRPVRTAGTVTVEVTVRGDVVGLPYTVVATAVSPVEPARQ